MPEPLVVAREISRSFPAGDRNVRRVIHDVSCLVMPADRIAMTGPSGSGKSTLLTILAGLDEPSSGQVAWPALAPNLERRLKSRNTFGSNRGFVARLRGNGGFVRDNGCRALGISVVFQAPSLLPELDIRQNVCLPLLLAGETRRLEARACELLGAFGIADLIDKLPGELSGGQAQRVAMARALITRPPLVLADEPTGQLDHATAASMLDAVVDFISGETALVVASHDEEVAGRMNKRWRLDHGHLQTMQETEVPS